MFDTENNLKEQSAIPEGNYLVCLVSKLSWKRTLLSIITNLLEALLTQQMPVDGSYRYYWIFILDSQNIYHVTKLKIDDDVQIWFDQYCNNLTTLPQSKIHEIYFNVAPEMLGAEKKLLKYKWRKTRLIPLPETSTVTSI